MSSKNIKIMQGALVCDESKLRGDITIGLNAIVHPSAVIYADSGPIVLGDTCIVEEQAKIMHRVPLDKVDKETVPVMTIGNHNIFEIDCTVEAAKIGDNNVFEAKCFVGNKVTITDGCVIGAGCALTEEMVLPKNTTVYGDRHIQRETMDKPPNQYGLMETLGRILPNYHHLRKPNVKKA